MKIAPPAAVVLVVEDEPIIRMAAIDLVEDAGYIAVAAADAAEAVRILESRPDIRVVFTDIDMPGSMDGMMLAMCIRDRWPPIRIIVVSGAQRPAAGDIPDDALFFSKPYRDADMTAAIRGMVDATA